MREDSESDWPSINKLPFLPEEYLTPLQQWLKRQNHKYLAEHHKYAACGNDSESLKGRHYADCMNYILLMFDYHMDDAPNEKKQEKNNGH